MNKIQWNNQDINTLKELRKDKKTLKQICEILDKPIAVIKKQLRISGLTKTLHYFTPQEDALIRELYTKGLTFKEIQQKLPHHDRVTIGIRAHKYLKLENRIKLWTDDEKEQYRQLKKEGKTYQEIAWALGRPVSSVRSQTTKFKIYSDKYNDWTDKEAEDLKSLIKIF